MNLVSIAHAAEELRPVIIAPDAGSSPLALALVGVVCFGLGVLAGIHADALWALKARAAALISRLRARPSAPEATPTAPIPAGSPLSAPSPVSAPVTPAPVSQPSWLKHRS